MKEKAPNWQGYKKGEKIVDYAQTRASLEGKTVGVDSSDLKEEMNDEESEKEIDASWKNPKISDQENYLLKENLIGHEEKQKQKIDEETALHDKLLKKYEAIKDELPELFRDCIEIFPEKHRRNEVLRKQLNVLSNRRKDLDEGFDMLNQVVSGEAPWDQVFSREELVKEIEKNSILHQQLEARRRLRERFKKWSFGLVDLDPDKAVLDHQARILAQSRIEEERNEYDRINQEILHIQHEAREISDWVSEKRKNPQFEELRDLNDEIASKRTFIQAHMLN